MLAYHKCLIFVLVLVCKRDLYYYVLTLRHDFLVVVFITAAVSKYTLFSIHFTLLLDTNSVGESVHDV